MNQQSAIRPPAPAARLRRRHAGVILSFVLLVLLPTVLTTGYLYTFAKDQYASTLGFTLRKEDEAVSGDIFAGFSRSLGGSTSTESEVLYAFIRSQDIVAKVDARLNLRDLYGASRGADPLLSFNPSGTVEDLTDYWHRMVMVDFDSQTGLIEVTARAFSPEDARAIASAIYEESTVMVNALSDQARSDATRYARDDLTRTEDHLRTIREELTAYRVANQIVDPQADVEGQMGLLNTLQTQLAEVLIEHDMLATTARDGDPRLQQLSREIDVIRNRIDVERSKFGSATTDDAVYAETLAEFERLSADREFAELAYGTARQAYELALAEAQRQSLYLATYIQPTLAERPLYPQRGLLIGTVFAISLLIWSVIALVYYSLRDRP